MKRSEFLSLGCCAFALVQSIAPAAEQGAAEPPRDPEKEFLKGWMTDLFEAMDKHLDQETRVRVMQGCGNGCFRRHDFKVNIAKAGAGDPTKLLEAYKKNFEVWREGQLVHIRYGETSKQCYCPAARYHPALPNDMHCECTRATHQAIFETALAKPVKVSIVQTLRRGGRTCEFVANFA